MRTKKRKPEVYSRRGYLKYLQAVADSDVAGLNKAEKSYADSWKKRGGVGAFMMLARKWDRLENQLERHDALKPKYDIFLHAQHDPRAEGVIDDIRDLRRYLTLVEAELLSRGINPKHRDNK